MTTKQIKLFWDYLDSLGVSHVFKTDFEQNNGQTLDMYLEATSPDIVFSACFYGRLAKTWLTFTDGWRDWLELKSKEDESAPEGSTVPDGHACNLTVGYKFCIRCLTPRPLTDFYRSNFVADGYARECKYCTQGKEVERGTVEENTAILFDNILVFGKSVSARLYAQTCRTCSIEQQDGDVRLTFTDDSGPQPSTSMFTWCGFSGTIALKDAAVLGALRLAFGLQPARAYVASLCFKRGKGVLNVITITGFTPYDFRPDEPVEEAAETPSEQPVAPSPAETEDSPLAAGDVDDVQEQLTEQSEQQEERNAPELPDYSRDRTSQDAPIERFLDFDGLRVQLPPSFNDELYQFLSANGTDGIPELCNLLLTADLATEVIRSLPLKSSSENDYYPTFAFEAARCLKSFGWKIQRPVRTVRLVDF